MQIIISFILGAFIGLVFAPKDFTIHIKNEKVGAQPAILSDTELEKLIGPEVNPNDPIAALNAENIAVSIREAMESVFDEEEDL